ncbi:MAG: chemotaxis protein CheW [Christensenellaceae bacterium]
MDESMQEIYVLENTQLLEQLEGLLLGGEKNASLSDEQVNETFRVMHTIKGSSAMMGFDSITKLAHAIEDLFSYIRDNGAPDSAWARIFDIVLEAIDFFMEEIRKVEQGDQPDGNADELVVELRTMYDTLSSGGEVSAEAAPAGDGEQQAGSEAAASESGEADAKVLEIGEKLERNEDDKVYQVKLFFDDDCQMETIRAYGVVSSIAECCADCMTLPEDLDENHDEEIVKDGLTIVFSATEGNAEVVRQRIDETMFMKSFEMSELDVKAPEKPAEDVAEADEEKPEAQEEPPADVVDEPAAAPVAQTPAPPAAKQEAAAAAQGTEKTSTRQSFISVNVNKIDKLMNLVGEIVTTEAMVTKNPDIVDLKLENFEMQARRLRKLTNELQDVVMSVRMVPIAATFHKMQRIVRDIAKKTGKEADLIIIGEDTEVDKSVIDNLSDPLMHMIRNAMDHGLETPDEREAAGKPRRGQVTLEARNSGGDVIVRVKDNGKGMDRDRIVEKAIANGLTSKAPDEISDQEAYGFTLMPGFSTREQATEFSGRGVGMDVVSKNMKKIGGRVVVDSEPGQGTVITMHIPLTLAIMDGMKVMVGDSMYIIPTLSIRESLEPRLHEIIVEPGGNELIIIRGECYPIIRLHEFFGMPTEVTNFNDGIMILVESELGSACLFVDKLLGEQQAVIKALPLFITKSMGSVRGVGGCCIMGDGTVALILDINNILV